MTLIREWTRILHGKGGYTSIIKLSKYNNICLWWPVDVLCYTLYSFLYKDIKREHYAKMRVINHSFYFYVFFLLFFNIGAKIFGLILRYINKSINEKETSTPIILFLTRDISWRKYKDYSHDIYIKGDVYLDSIINVLKKSRKNISVLGVSPLEYNFLKSIKIKIERIKDPILPVILFEKYFKINHWIIAFRFIRKTINSYNRMIENQNLTKLSLHKQKNTLKELLEFCMKMQFVALLQLMTALSLIENIRPKIIVSINEYGLWERAFRIASQQKNIPFIAIQHGVIHENHRGYMYEKEEVYTQENIRVPLPDRLLVYGPEYKVMLTKKGNYPSDIIYVVGNPKYDALVKLKEKNISQVREKLGLPQDKRIILWATQQHGLPYKENKINIETIVKTLEKLGHDYILLIKQHPGEKKEHDSIIKNAVKRLRGKILIIPKDLEAYEYIYASDLLITKTSTIALDAAVLNKPIIIMNLSEEPEETDYVKNGLGIGAYSFSQLVNNIIKVLEKKEDYINKAKLYVEKKLYKLDGKASQRIANIILQYIDETN